MSLNYWRLRLQSMDKEICQLLERRAHLLSPISRFKQPGLGFDPLQEAKKRAWAQKQFGESIMVILCQWMSLARSQQQEVYFVCEAEDIAAAYRFLGVFSHIRVESQEQELQTSEYRFCKDMAGDFYLQGAEAA